MTMRLALACCIGLVTTGAAQSAAPAGLPARDYRVLVASEATDEVAFLRFGPGGAVIEKKVEVGLNPSEPDGPHGLATAPRGGQWFVSIAHGTPFGELWKLDAAGRPQGRVELGLFPASMQVSPDGHYVYVANFNLHGDMVPSSISIVATAEMLEVARVETCAMPHGSRFNGAGSRHYSTCMMDEALVEIDATDFTVSRHFLLTRGSEHGGKGRPGAAGGATDHSGHGLANPTAGNVKCSPTWAAPTMDGKSVYVACNATSDIVEIDADAWTIRRRIPAGNGVYNLAVTKDGKILIATNKRDQSVSIFDAATGKELKRLPTKRKVVHGIAVSDDDRYAFISVEGIGSEPGTVEMIDLKELRTVATVDVGQMAGGIDIVR